MGKFIAGLFKHRKPAPPTEAPKPEPERLPPEALARAAREAEAARLDADRRQAGADEIRRACQGPARYWWPGEVVPENRLSGRSWPARVLERIFGGWS
jgi:hypothetical protein